MKHWFKGGSVSNSPLQIFQITPSKALDGVIWNILMRRNMRKWFKCWQEKSWKYLLRRSYNFNYRYKWNVQNGTTFVGEQLGLIPKGWYQFLKLFTTHDIQAI